MRSRRWVPVAIVLAIIAAITYTATPYVRAASLFARVGNIGGRVEAFADAAARTVTVQPRHGVPTPGGVQSCHSHK